jgi:4-hydroxy-tetrahydrodipicolinate synthase
MFQGVYTALITPFTRDLRIDEEALRRLVDQQISAGVDGLVPMGTTGESPTVTHEENIEVIRIVVEEAAGRVPVIAGTGSNSTAEAVDMTVRARDLGADATLQVAPYYNKPSQEGFFRHFRTVAEKGGLPVLVYNIPGRTAKNIESATLVRLSRVPGIVGVKEASGDLAQVMEIISGTDENFSVLSGDDNITLPMMSLGGHGVVSVASNLVPARMKELVSLAAAGKGEEARKLHYELMPLFKAMFLDTNPIPVKHAYGLMHHLEASYRLPLCEPSEETAEAIAQVLRELNLI